MHVSQRSTFKASSNQARDAAIRNHGETIINRQRHAMRCYGKVMDSCPFGQLSGTKPVWDSIFACELHLSFSRASVCAMQRPQPTLVPLPASRGSMETSEGSTDRRDPGEYHSGRLATAGERVEADDRGVVEGDDDVDHLDRGHRRPRDVGAVRGAGSRRRAWA